MRQRWAWAMALGIAAQLWSLAAHAQCSKDVDCKGDRICSAGVCATPNPAPPAAPPAAAPQAAAQSQPGVPRTQSIPFAPLSDAQAPIAYRRKSTGLMVGGIVVGSVGIVSLLSGIGLGVASSNCRKDLEAKYPTHSIPTSEANALEHCRSQASTSTVLVLVGLVLTVAGVPMFVVGGKQVPVYSGATLTPWLDPRAGGLSLQLSM